MAERSSDEMSRKPRVHIQYKLQTGDATEKIDLPFVMGVLADLSGDQDKADLEKREMMEVEGGNLNGIMAAVNPRVVMKVPNRLLEGAKDPLSIDLTFATLGSFGPDQLAARVPELAGLMKVSQQLKELETTTANKGLSIEAVLQQILDEVRKTA